MTPEEERRQAESKSLTVEPLHEDIIVDDEPDTVKSARSVNSPALANISNDTEQNQPVITPAKGFLETAKPRPPLPQHVRSAVIASLIFLIIIIATIIVYVLT